VAFGVAIATRTLYTDVALAALEARPALPKAAFRPSLAPVGPTRQGGGGILTRRAGAYYAHLVTSHFRLAFEAATA
jgi:hypothetical protein